MINCARCREQLSAYLDGLMTVEEKGLIEEHLSRCQHCSLVFAELKKTQETLRNLEEVEPPPWFTQKTMNRIREEAESRKGLFQKLFYPLRIKIPMEALATCLIVVLALFVYKNTEPEIKVIHQPHETVIATPQEQTQKQDSGVSSAPKETQGRSGGIQKENREQEKNAINTVRPESTAAGGSAMNKPAPAETPEPQMAKKEAQGTGNRYEAKKSEGETVKKQELTPAQESVAAPAAKLKEDRTAPTIGSVAVKGTQDSMKAPAALEIQARSVAEPKQILFTVLTNDIEATVKETEGLLNGFGAKNIKRSSRQPRSVIFDADLPGQKAKGFLDSLKSVGDVIVKDMPSKSPEGYLAVHIEITANP
jgi:hypothetical protein